MPSFGYSLDDDPLGIALQDRAQKSRQQYQLNEGWGHSGFGPLPDPKWEGLFQAMKEQGVDQLAGGNVPGSNMFVGQKHLSGQHGAGEIGPPGFARPNPIMHGLQHPYQSHEEWLATNPAAIAHMKPQAPKKQV